MCEFKIFLSLVGAERKVIVELAEKIFGTNAAYDSIGVYAISGWLMHRDKTLESPVLTLEKIEKVNGLLAAFSAEGIYCGSAICIEILRVSKETEEKIKALLSAKDVLLRRALRLDRGIKCERSAGALSLLFSSDLPTAEYITAYIVFALKLAAFANKLKYTTMSEKLYTNEKYAMRCFLLRLGFIGNEYKQIRKTLMRSLQGDTASKTIRPKQITETLV